MSRNKPKSRLEAFKSWMIENKFPKVKLTLNNQNKSASWSTEKI